MTTPGGQQGIRQHERFTCSLPAEVTVAPAHEDQLRPVRTSAESTGLSATVVDCGRGGLGLNTPTFLPKQSQVLVRVRAGELAFTAPLRVMRSQMVDRQPTYYLGCALTDANPEHQAMIAQLVEYVKGAAGAEHQ